MGIIRVLDHVERCYNSADGKVIHDVIEARLKKNEQVVVSFDGVDSVPSSFVNTALISLLETFDFQRIKNLLRFKDTNSQINEMIKTRFDFEVHKRRDGHPA